MEHELGFVRVFFKPVFFQEVKELFLQIIEKKF